MNLDAAFRKLSTPARPSGLRNEVLPSPGFAVVIASPVSKVSVPSRKHKIYKCRWKDCSAELHNLETLKKHTYNHIDDFDEADNFYCLWNGCGGGDGRGPLQFKSETSWHRHMNGRHLDHLAWKFGDGPSSQDDESDFLSDSQQRQVTPQPRPQSQRPDPLIVPHVKAAEMAVRTSAIRAYHAAHGNRNDEQKSQTIFDSQLERRRALGAGIVKVGTGFVNEERQALLQHDSYHLRLVSDEGEDDDD